MLIVLSLAGTNFAPRSGNCTVLALTNAGAIVDPRLSMDEKGNLRLKADRVLPFNAI